MKLTIQIPDKGIVKTFDNTNEAKVFLDKHSRIAYTFISINSSGTHALGTASTIDEAKAILNTTGVEYTSDATTLDQFICDIAPLFETFSKKNNEFGWIERNKQ